MSSANSVTSIRASATEPPFSASRVALWVTITFAVTTSALAAGLGQGTAPRLGKPIDAASVAPFDISIAPDGVGLPAGSGTAKQGATVFANQCASCHGEDGKGGKGLADPLVGGVGSLATNAPVKTVGSFWPYATTLFDYTRRAMPLNAPMSLSHNDAYAVTAYVLFLNDIVAEGDSLDAKTLAQIKMPNRDGFKSALPAL